MLILAAVATDPSGKWNFDYLIACEGRTGWVLDVADVEIETLNSFKMFVSDLEWNKGPC